MMVRNHIVDFSFLGTLYYIKVGLDGHLGFSGYAYNVNNRNV